MNAITFDTLHFANKLKAVGFTDEQAQVITELQRTVIDNTLEQARHDYHLDDLATKRDLKEMDTALRHEIELLRADTGRMIAETKAELIRWVVGVGLLQTSLIIGALMKMAHLI